MRVWRKNWRVLKEKEWPRKTEEPDQHQDQKHLHFVVYSREIIEGVPKEEASEDQPGLCQSPNQFLTGIVQCEDQQ